MQSVVTASNHLGATNISDEAISTVHLDLSSPVVFTSAGNKEIAATTANNMSSQTYSTVTLNGVALNISNINATMSSGSVLTLDASMLTKSCSLLNPAFDRISYRFGITEAGSGSNQVGPAFGFSLGGCNTVNLGSRDNDCLEYQRHTIHTRWIHTSSIPSTVTNVLVQVQVLSASNSFSITNANLAYTIENH